MCEPTDKQITDALHRARVMFVGHQDWDLIKAVAEATTTEQCGIPSWMVFRDARNRLQSNLPQHVSLANFNETAERRTVLELLDTAIRGAA